tara:strand:- start:3832 stop:4743 length:912 start_codon:yes stop_codon:yes gene_type:complete
MRKHKFIKFINIDKKLYKILKNLTNKDLAENNIYIKSLDKFVKRCKKILDEKNDLSALIISLYPKNEKISKLSALYIKRLTEIMSGYAGEILHQNSSKDKVIEVFDRSRNLSINRGSRYHQTREGGSIHTDNVNIPSYWDYLMFSCLASAKAGGETILVDSKKIHEELSKNFKEAKKILEKNFYWEKRGLSEELYKAPIISYDKMKQPRFKYLRPYLESAHVKAKKNLSNKQLYALDVLDALLETGKFQFRYKMEKGDILFNLDSKVLHGRSSFSDSLNALPIEKFKNNEQRLKRTMIRIWIK